MKRRIFSSFLSLALGAAALLGAATPAAAEDKPTVIRIGFPGVSAVGQRPIRSGDFTANAHLLKTIDKEFAADGIKIDWKFYVGAGPALNEAFANGQLDFCFAHGDLPLIVGRSTGLKHHIIASGGRFADSYLTVPSGSSAKSLADLKGKKLAAFKGTAGQLTLYRWFERYGFTPEDFRVVSMTTEDTKAALATGDIDGSNSTPFDLQARGVARWIDKIENDPIVSRPSTVWVGEEFEKKYPSLVQRVVTRLVKDAYDASQESGRQKLYSLWTQDGTPLIDIKTSWDKEKDLRERINPLLDDYYVASIKRSIAEVKKYKLSRREAVFDGWIEPKYLNNALAELKLEDYWPQYDANGKVVKPGRKLK
jgi:sulfonate transport system substrate-binding protein